MIILASCIVVFFFTYQPLFGIIYLTVIDLAVIRCNLFSAINLTVIYLERIYIVVIYLTIIQA